MFFDQDILFRNGPLALVWLAGTESFKGKKNRKEYLAVISSNMLTMCTTMRNLFPQMGTAHGIPLKKMATLAKGLTVIYQLKIKDLSKEILQASMMFKRRVTFDMKALDTKPKGRGEKRVLNEDEAMLEIDMFEMTVFGYGESLFRFPSPRQGREMETPSLLEPSDGDIAPFNVQDTVVRRVDRDREQRKRKRGDEEADVLKRLHDVFAQADANAHLLLEDEPLEMPGADLQAPDLDFGDGMDLMRDVPEQQAGPAYPDEDFVGPPTNVEDDSRFKVPETPAGAETTAENTRRRRNEGEDAQAAANTTVMQLEEIEGTPRRVKRAKRRLALRVDKDTAFTAKDLYLQVEACRQENDAKLLMERAIHARAPGKSIWEFEARYISGLHFIRTAGRPCRSLALAEMVEEAREKQRAFLPEAQRQGDAGGTTIGGMSVVSGAAGRTVHDPLAAEGEEVRADPVPEEQYAAFDDGIGVAGHVAPVDEPIEDGVRAPAESPFREPPRRPRRESRTEADEEAAMTRKLPGQKTFEDLYPPEKSRKGQAARAFLTLLKMQAKKVVSLKQEEPFGDISVEKLNLNV